MFALKTKRKTEEKDKETKCRERQRKEKGRKKRHIETDGHKKIQTKTEEVDI
jgi:hypothetical protein